MGLIKQVVVAWGQGFMAEKPSESEDKVGLHVHVGVE